MTPEEARKDERAKVGRELQELADGYLADGVGGLLPFALSDIASRLINGQHAYEDPLPVVIDSEG